MLTGPELNHILRLCSVSIQKARSNITESYESYLQANPESYLERTFPNLFSADSRLIFNSWSRLTNKASVRDVYDAICYIKANSEDASRELYSNLIRAGYAAALFHDTAGYFGYAKVLSDPPPLNLPTHNFVIPRALGFIFKVKRLLDSPNNWVSFNIGVEAEDKNGTPVEFDADNAVRWTLWGAKTKLLYQLYNYDERWKVELDFNNDMRFALRDMILDTSFLSVCKFKVYLTHSELINWLDWAAYHRHSRGPFV